MKNFVVLGNNLKAVTAATVLASVGFQVTITPIDANVDFAVLLKEFAFDHELCALWKLYSQENSIIQLPAEQLERQCVYKDEIAQSEQAVWIFYDSEELDKLIKQQFAYLFQLQRPILMTGTLPIGQVTELSKRFISTDVFYIPFVFLQDGASFASMLSPNLLLVGEKVTGSFERFSSLSALVKHADNVQVADIKTIEFTRSSMMAMLASRLSFINEMSRLADAFQVNIKTVTALMGLDSRIGNSYLNANWGFGGTTLPNELSLLQASFNKTNTDTKLIQAISDINADQKELIFRKFWQYFDSHIKDKRVLIWGAGYKAGSGRTDNSAIHALLHLFWQYNISSLVYDPQAQYELAQLYPSQNKLILVNDPFERIENVDAIFILNYPDATRPNKHKLAQVKVPVFDAQNLLNSEEVALLAGFYTGLGQ